MLINLNGISKEYDVDGKKIKILDDINLQIDSGEYVAIMGESGAGKTTLINIIGFIDRDYQGDYQFDGQSVSSMSNDTGARLRNQHVGFVFQNFKLIRNLTIFQNVQLPLLYAGKKKEETKTAVLNSLDKVGLLDKRNKYPQQLSGGQQQRVAIAIAIVNNPDFMIADEPTGALDINTSNEIMKIFERLHQQGKTILIVTHDPHVGELAKRLIRISDGQIESDREVN